MPTARATGADTEPDPDTDDDDLGSTRQARTARRRSRNVTIGSVVLAGAMAVAVLDGLGAVDAVGVDDVTVSDQRGPVSLEVRYPTVSRPGLASPLELTVRQEGGFDEDTVDVAISADYLLLWDLNGILPAPSAETADADRLIWTFDVLDGEVLTIRYEARIEPARQSGTGGRVAVLDGAGAEVVAVDLYTDIRP